MSKFRKKPVEVEAIQYWVPTTRDEIIAWTGARHTFMDDDGALQESLFLTIHTSEGDMRAMPGDWIIRGVKGEFYPCKPDIFELTYEACDD